MLARYLFINFLQMASEPQIDTDFHGLKNDNFICG
jgi:hypothetical protein